MKTKMQWDTKMLLAGLVTAALAFGAQRVYANSTGITTQQILTLAPADQPLTQASDVQGTSLGVARADHVHKVTGVLPVANGGTGLTSLTMGGDLLGSYPNPLVVALQGVPLTSTAPVAGDMLFFQGGFPPTPHAQTWSIAPGSGDVVPGTGGLLITAIQGVPVSGAPSGGNVLTYVGGDGEWEPKPPATSGTVTSVAAGTGLSASPSPVIGAGTLSLANTAVSPASYTNTSLTVDQQGRITAASSGTAPVTSVGGTSPIASSGGTTPAISLNDTAVTPASYGDATHVGAFTVDQKGRLTAASSTSISGLLVSALTGSGAVNHFICSNGAAWSPCSASGDGTFDGTGALTLKSVGTASTYGDASHVAVVTTDAQGRVSSASSTSIAIAASQVTSGLQTIATTGALTDGTGTLLVTHGGTGLTTLTAHALYVGNGTSAPTAVGLGTSTKVLHGAAAGDPTFSAVALGADVSGTLPTGNGGIGSDTSATSGYPVWASGVVSFNNAATTLAALGGAATGGVAGAWGAINGSQLNTTGAGSMLGGYTPATAGKFRNTTCELATAGVVGIGSATAITVKIRDLTAASDVCTMTMMVCNTTTVTTADCNTTATAAHTYELELASDGGCATPAQFLFCNVGMQQP